MIVVSTGCPAGVGPEVSVSAAANLNDATSILVGDEGTLRAAAERVGVATRRLVLWEGEIRGERKKSVGSALKPRGAIFFVQAGPLLGARDRKPGKPTETAGAAQLAYVDAAYDLVKNLPGSALVSGPVSKAAIAHSGAPGAATFRGHTEWLRDRDDAPYAIMCFAAKGMVTSLVTTHLPLSRVPRALTARGVRDSTVELVRLVRGLGKQHPTIAIASLNPHAGGSELFGQEEAKAILPGIALAAAVVRKTAKLVGPVGAETAYRLLRAGHFDGVVAMYHDQATIPMKLVAFGDAVNVTMGLSVVRTSVDHGTAYDIAWTGKANPGGMIAAMKLAEVLVTARD
jgi:4-hydroxythreonine-4-phosphate dehydrogenase